MYAKDLSIVVDAEHPEYHRGLNPISHLPTSNLISQIASAIRIRDRLVNAFFQESEFEMQIEKTSN